VHVKEVKQPSAEKKPRPGKIAWLSPLPPQRSGIANYSYSLVKALKPRLDIDLYYDGQTPVTELQEEFDIYPMAAFAAKHESYDEAIYHIGNNSDFHKAIYEYAWRFPGTVVLHDYNLSGFMHEAFYRQNQELYRQALTHGNPDEGRKGFQSLIIRLFPGSSQFPMSQAIVSRSKKVIVHHRWLKNQFPDNDHIEVIPHFAKLNRQPDPEEIGNFRRKLAIRNDHFVLTCLGFINPNKLPGLQINVVKRLVDDGYPVQLVFAGEPAPEIKDLVIEVRSGKYHENIIFTGYQNESDYFNAIFASDIIINLRNPSMGEASGTLMHALAAAKPTIVSDANQYREFPDKVCWKLADDENQAEVLYAYIRVLMSDPLVRETISMNASNFVRTVLAWEKIVARWRETILRSRR
jgi:glycosyltransferase involved in cell wall biosynthesis